MSMFCFTSDPVMDAESYQMELEQQPHIYCEDCGKTIYLETPTHYASEPYTEFQGRIRCHECTHRFLAKVQELEEMKGW